MKRTKPAGIWTGSYLRVFLTNLMLMLVNNGLPSVFTLYLMSRGGTDLDSGLATTCYYCISLLARPLAGWLLDNRDRRKIVTVTLAGLALIPWGFVFAVWIALILFCRTLHGAFCAACATALTTNAYDVLSPESFSEGVSYLGFSNAIATAIGPAVGLWLFREFGDIALFAMCSLTALIGLILMRSFDYKQMVPSGRRIREEKILDLVLEKEAVPAAVLQSFCAVMSGGISTYFAVFFIENGNFFDAGRYFAVQSVGTFLSRFFVGKISDRYGEGPLVWSSSILFSVGIYAVVLAKAPWPIYFGALCLGVGYGFTVTGMQIMSVRTVKPERRGAAASTYTCAWDIAAALGGVIAGVLAELVGYKAMFLIMSAVYPAYLVTYLLWGRRQTSAFRVWKKNTAATNQ